MPLGDGVLGDILPDDQQTTAGAIGFLAGKVKAQIKDESEKLTTDDIQDAVASAVEKYSSHKPVLKTVEAAGAGTTDLALPSGWITDFSSVKKIEYPVGKNPEEYLEPEDYGFYDAPAGRVLRLRGYSPDVDAAVYVTFTALRDETTIPLSDVRALVYLASSYCFEQLANRYVDSSDSTIQADSVNYRTKSQEAASRAKALLKLYKEHMGLKDEDTVAPASAVASSSIKYPGGGERLTHPWRGRRLR